MAVWVDLDELQVFFTTVGDAPERIKMVTIDTSLRWTDWVASDPIEVLRREMLWEGSGQVVEPSIRSFVPGPVNQLRDPFVFSDLGGEKYPFYAAAGESGIAVARLTVNTG